MKGKNTFTKEEARQLLSLIQMRIHADRSEQKKIRNKMRNIGFYGGDDFGISDLQPEDFEQLIASGRIEICDSSIKLDSGITKEPIKLTSIQNTPLVNSPVKYDLSKFQKFLPLTDSENNIPNLPGNYIVCLKNGSKLPDIGVECITQKLNDLEVIYTGIASQSLKTRDYEQHFCGNNAGRSTLRKSIGAMFGYRQIPRDKDPNTGKTKFSDEDEQKLSKWMRENLILYFFPNNNPEELEDGLILKLNPPLNLNKNKNFINLEYRQELSRLRNIKAK